VKGGRRGAALAAGVALAIAVPVYSQAASTAPKPTIAQVQARVNSLQAQVDQVGQQYDQLGQQLATAKARLTIVQRKNGVAFERFTVAQAKLRQVAVASYEHANQSSVARLLTTGDPTQVLRQASLLEQLGNMRSAQVGQFVAAAQQVEAARAQVRRTESGVTQLQGQLATKKKALTRLLTASQAMLNNLNLQQQAEVAAAAVGSGNFVTSASYLGPTNTPAGKAVQFAYSKLGTWYLWGGTGPQYDCSGLVQAAWAAGGVSIPRTTYEQWAALPHVSKASLQPGDLVFFNGEGHVSMYVGDGLMIDAPRTGEQVRLLPLDTTWYAQTYDGAVRP